MDSHVRGNDTTRNPSFPRTRESTGEAENWELFLKLAYQKQYCEYHIKKLKLGLEMLRHIQNSVYKLGFSLGIGKSVGFEFLRQSPF
jgi:hypothetical protein